VKKDQHQPHEAVLCDGKVTGSENTSVEQDGWCEMRQYWGIYLTSEKM